MMPDAAPGLTWPQARRRVLQIAGVLALLAGVYVVKSMMRYRALVALEAHGGVLWAADPPRLFHELMGLDGCYGHSIRPRPSRFMVFLHDQYALQTRCDVTIDAPAADEALAVLPDLPCVTSLQVASTSFSDADLLALRRLHRLEWLNLNKTRVTDAGLVHLAQFPELRRLDLAETKISEAGLESLKRLPNLEYVDLCRTGISEEVARRALGAITRPCPEP